MNRILFFVLVLTTLAGCKPKKSALETYDRATMLKSLADNVVVPAYADMKLQSDSLYTAAQNFTTNPNSGNLSVIISAWNNAVSSWMHVEMYNFYYASDNSLASQIATWPVDFPVIENEVDGSNTIDEAYVAATGTTRKGLSAIEYLLYGDGITQQAILDSFITSINAQRRKAYLLALCAHVKTQSASAYNDWNGGNSYSKFTTQTQLDISGAMNLLVNGLTEHVEYVRKAKVGKPLGTEGNAANGALCENRLASRSLDNVKANIAAWKNIVTGRNGVGLDDYLDYVNAQYNGQPLSTELANQLDLCEAKCNDITLPLSNAVTQQQSQVQALYLELKKLTVLTKVDMASNLGVVITFSDNDGD